MALTARLTVNRRARGESDAFFSFIPSALFLFLSTAGEAMQRDDRSGEGVRQRQQALRQRHPGSVSAVQEGRDDLGEVLMRKTRPLFQPFIVVLMYLCFLDRNFYSLRLLGSGLSAFFVCFWPYSSVCVCE